MAKEITQTQKITHDGQGRPLKPAVAKVMTDMLKANREISAKSETLEQMLARQGKKKTA